MFPVAGPGDAEAVAEDVGDQASHGLVPGAACQFGHDGGVRIVLPDTGKGYYPDFVICVDGRKRRDGIALAETKERIESDDSGNKSRSEHRDYGRALMLTYDSIDARFIRVEYDFAMGRNRAYAMLEPRDLVVD